MKFGTAQSQLDRLEASAASFKTWDGPLYLERHQGTMTTHAQMKRRNRRLEERLRELELRFAVSTEIYPRQILRECWQTLLTNQFHDILPGSSITCVYQEAHATYTEIESRLNRLEAGLPAGSSVLFNPHSTDFCGVIENGNGQWMAVKARALSTTAVAPAKVSDAVSVTASLLENELVRYTFNHDGRLLSAYDKTLEREFMNPGESGNCLSLYQDHFGDAWDTDKAVLEQRLTQAVSTTAPAVRAFGLAGEIEFTLMIGRSTVRQVVRLRALSRRLDFITSVTWQEERKQLRVSFPLDLRAREAKAEIQFGLQAYSLTENTAWDRAQSDVPAQRFADISEGNCGVALLNDSKYGVHLKGRTIDLNLLRSSLYPDETADRGEHTFTYALLPHAGCLEESDVLHEARLLNQPVRQVRMAEVALPFTFMSNSVVLETIKRAEESDDLVLRLYEPHGRRGRVTLCGNNLSFHESNLLEEAGAAMEMTDGSAQFTLRPFEVKTVLCRV